MFRHFARRLAASLLLLLVVLTLSFALVRAAPGDPFSRTENQRLTAEQIEQQRRLFGLDKPLHIQYLDWLREILLRWNWGISFVQQRPATEVLAQALPATLVLAAASLLVTYTLGIWMGVAAARRPDSWTDHLLRTGSLILYSVPTFWLGLMALLLFHWYWPILPGGGTASPGAVDLPPLAHAADRLRHLVLPALVLGLVSAGRLARFVRNDLLDVLRRPYVRTARAKGLSERRVLWCHALRSSLVPVVQLLGLSLPALLNGVLVIEVVFAWPGLGQAIFSACLARDYPVILASTALSAALVVTGTLLADLLHGLVDPRVRDA